MWNVVLISGDQKTHEEVKALLPKGASLEEFTSLKALPRPSAAPAEGGYSNAIILIELAGEPIPAGRIEPFRLAGIPLVAVITSPAQREAAYRAGFDDYLLRPVSNAEWKSRLDRLAHAFAADSRNSPAVLERERQAAVGRLTSYFCHAVNNAMQTIRGAVDLAREESNLPAPIAEYLAICRKETVVIGAKINRLRQIYRPQPAPPEPVALEELLHEALQMAADDLLRNNVSVKEQFESPLPAIHSSGDRLALAFLMMIFHLSQDLGDRGGGGLRVQAGRDHGFVQVSLCAIPGPANSGAESAASDSIPAGLETARELIQTERGQLQAFHREGGFCLQARFPAGGGSQGPS